MGLEIDLSTSVSGDGQARRAMGMAHVPEDRQREGLIMDFMAWENAVFGYHREKSNQANKFFMDNNAIRKETEEKMKRFDVRPPNPKLTAKNFSGGNQQKIVLAREIERNPDLLLVGQPTRGVDIGAIEFIHQQIVALRDQGKAILLISVELDEILSLSDRVLVMFDGEIMGASELDQPNSLAKPVDAATFDKIVADDAILDVYNGAVHKGNTDNHIDDISDVQLAPTEERSFFFNEEDKIKYEIQSNFKIQNEITNSYDLILNDKYKVEIYNNTLERLKNYFR